MAYLTAKHFVYTINGLDFIVNFKNLIKKSAKKLTKKLTDIEAYYLIY